VVIPAFNSAEWLPSTLSALKQSLSRSSWDAEIIIVNDGSTDDTADVLEREVLDSSHAFRVITQVNQGRFLARWSGISAAKNDHILLLDSRVLLSQDSLNYLENSVKAKKCDLVWNAFVETDANASLPGFFWDIPTRLFWGDFLGNPHSVRFGLKDFDRYPKGTTCLFLEKTLLESAYLKVWPEADLALISDDTRLLREIVRHRDIVLDPSFHATYRPRVFLASFLAHTFDRGTLFVDSYAGTALVRRATILLAGFGPLGSITLIASGLSWIVGLGVALIVSLPTVIGALRRAPLKAIASYLLLILPFGLVFWAGLIRGIWVHRRHFALNRKEGLE
jgi:glycosyltransferase involved in cell wall biosynthesis